MAREGQGYPCYQRDMMMMMMMMGLVGRVPVVLHPSLYRALKLTFPRDVGGLAHDGAINNEMATGSMSQTVGVLTPAMFSPGTQPL